MSNPTIPCVDRQEAITNLIEALALEEAAIAHLINAEAEKAQAVAEKLPRDLTVQQVLEIQNKIIDVISVLAEKEKQMSEKLTHLLSFR